MRFTDTNESLTKRLNNFQGKVEFPNIYLVLNKDFRVPPGYCRTITTYYNEEDKKIIEMTTVTRNFNVKGRSSSVPLKSEV
jgi:hypothetical protein